MAAIEVNGLQKSYGDVRAVDGVSFSVPEGQVFSFLGPNGAGKTTTVEILEGLRNRSGGEVRVLGLDPWSEGRTLHNAIGVIPQDFRFYEKITPREAIQYYGELFGTEPDADSLLQQVVLSEKADARFDTLSGGQKQKLGLALSLTNDPKLLFLDEPTTGLDPQARRGIWDVIRRLKSQKRTVFLTTHYLEEAELLSDQVAIIDHGKIIADGTANQIIAAHGGPPHLVVEGPSSLRPVVEKVVHTPVETLPDGVRVALNDRADVVAVMNAVQSSGVPWRRFSMEQETLEDVFVRMVGQMDEGVVKGDGST